MKMNYKRESESCQGFQESSLVAAPFFEDSEDLPLAIANEKAFLRTDFKNKKKMSQRSDKKVIKEVVKKNFKKNKKVNIIPHSTETNIPANFISEMVGKLKKMEESSVVNFIETVITMFFMRIRDSKVEKVLIGLVYFIKVHLGDTYANLFKQVLLGVDRNCLRPLKEWDFHKLQSFVKDLFHNYTLASKNEAFGAIIALVSTCLAICYGADKKVAWTVGSFSVFVLDARNACKGATNLVDSLLKVASYIINGVREYCEKGTMSGFLYSDDQLAGFDAKVTDLQCKFSLIHPGNLEKYADIDENQFDNDLQKTIVEGERLVLIFDGNTKKYIMDRVRILCKMHAEFIQFRAAGGLRIAPFAYVISGSSGLGKSSVNEILMRYILSVNGYNHQDAYICTVNSQDKYFSSYRSFVNGVIMDDFANENPEFVEESPCNTLLRFINNVPYYLNMAEVDMKGKVVAEPKVVGVTTNVSSLNADVYSNQPSSIVRRLKAHIHVKVKEEFTKENSIELDSAKVTARFGENCIAPDIWNFDVYTINIEAIDRTPKMDYQEVKTHRDDNWKMELVEWNGHPMTGATLPELLLYLKQSSKIHYDTQKSLVERSKQFNDVVSCQKCENFITYCSCVNNVTEASASMGDIQSIELLLQGDLIVPHSTYSKAFDRLTDGEGVMEAFRDESEGFFHDVIKCRKEGKLKSSLRSLLISWVMQGRSSFDEWYNSFVSKLDAELQYLFNILKIVITKQFLKWKGLISELLIPVELENSVVGDYLNLVARHKQVLIVTKISKCIEQIIWLALLSYFTGKNYSNSISKLASFVVISAAPFLVKPSSLVVKMLMRLLKVKEWLLDKLSQSSFYNRYNSEYVLAPVLVASTFCIMKGKDFIRNPILRKIYSVGSTYLVTKGIMKFRNSAIEGHECPRSVSQAYLKFKQGNSIKHAAVFPPAMVIVGVVYNWDSLFKIYEDLWNSWYIEPHSTLNPDISEIKVRDKKHKFDEDWFKTQADGYLDPLPSAGYLTSSEVRNAISDNLWHITNINNTAKTNAFVLSSGYLIVPWHFINDMKGRPGCIRVLRHNRGNIGNKSFEMILEPCQCIKIGVHDLALCWVPKTGDVKNMINLFPLRHHSTFDLRTGRIVTRDLEGELHWSDVTQLRFTAYARSDSKGDTFPGAMYFWDKAEKGTCISPIVSDDRKATISGLHIGGSTELSKNGSYLCFASTPTQDELLQARNTLEAFPTVVPMSASGEFPTSVMGVSVLERVIKKKSCYLRMDCTNNAKFLGSSTNCNRVPKSKVRETFIKSDILELFKIKTEWSSPFFKGPNGRSPYIPWEVGMEKWISNKPGLFFSQLNKAKVDYLTTLLYKLAENKEYWIEDMKVLSWEQTVNGVPGKRFIDSMNFKSSIGFPFHGSKKLFSTDLGDTNEGWQHKRVLRQDFILEAEKIEKLYLDKKRYYPWYVSTLKDEPTESTKTKVRIFQASSTPFQLVVRKYTLPICRFLQMNPLISESAVGIDPCSEEWHEMFMHLKGMQSHFCDKWFAVDYKAYDTSISSQLILAVGRVFIDIAKYIGWCREYILILEAIFTELAFSIVDFNGDVLMLDGANPSGNPLTVFINGLSNSLLMRICFYYYYPNLKFSEHVRMMDYGDDLIGSVRKTVPLFNMVSYADFLAPFGFTVTPASKSGVLQEYVPCSEVDFLKRKFVWSDDFKHYIGPLEENSIYKRLCNYMSSDTDVELIVGSNIDGALDEWTFYGRQIYKSRQKILKMIVKKHNLSRFVSRIHLTYDERVKFWFEKIASPAVKDKGRSMVTEKFNDDKNFFGFFGWGNIFSGKEKGDPPKSSNQTSNSYDEVNGNKLTTTIKEESIVWDTKSNPCTDTIKEEIDSEGLIIIPHSTKRLQLMSIEDAEVDQDIVVAGTVDPTRSSRDSIMNSLGDFLSRPVQIYSGFWSPSVQFNYATNPWLDFLSNKRVVNRINNYKLYRGTLNIKIMVNGNGFYYGRLMASYVPFFYSLDKMSSASLEPADSVQMSQMPRVFIDPTTSTGGTMKVPFFWHKDYVHMLDSINLRNLGSLHIREINGLKHTSGDGTLATKVSINVFAWMDDVQLDAPTATNVGFIVPQSSKAVDERQSEMGPISKLATAIENMANEGSSVPALAPFCLPAQIGARMLRAGASTYGWSSPSIIEEAKPLLPRGIGNTAVTNGPDTALKMTMDLKQEVSVDPRIMGLGDTDELDIKYIASRESYLTTIDWTLANEPKDLIYNLRVDPCQWVQAPGPSEALCFPACCGATIPFQYWTGTFKLRLQIVASAFHRGRLMVVYDPVRTVSPYEENVAYSQIIDIASSKDVVFTVGPNQETTLMTHALPGVNALSQMRQGGAPLGEENFGNGTIAIYVMNELTIPNSTGAVNNDIKINLFISMGDDFEVFVPSHRFSDYVIKPQSTDIADPVHQPQNYGGLSEEKPMDLATDLDSHLNVVYSGEKIRSFRMLMKRYYYHTSIFSAASAVGDNFSLDIISHPAFPMYRGNVPGAVHDTAVAGVKYNYMNTTLLNYLAPAFSARRGSLRWKLTPKIRFNSGISRSTKKVYLTHNTGYSIFGYNYAGAVAAMTNSRASYHELVVPTTTQKNNCTLLISSIINPNCEYEIPFYSNYRFVPGKLIDQDGSDLTNNVTRTGVHVEIDKDNNGVGRIYNLYVSAGEDFSFYFFTGWPRMYYEQQSEVPPVL